MKTKIGVIGVGTAGILSISHLLTYLSNDFEIISIYDPKKPILGIGESSNPVFVNALEYAADFTLLNDLEPLEGTYKFGTVYKNWREKDFVIPMFNGNCAIHFNTFKLKDFMFPRFYKKWNRKFSEELGEVENITNKSSYVEVTIDGEIKKFDYIIDCTGFPTDMTNYHISELPLNHCLVHNGDPIHQQYTGHVATKNGWMFTVPLSNRMSYGYLFNDNITNKEEAKKDFSEEINVPVDKLQNIEYKFNPYYAKQIFDGRILKNGNQAVFFEPISANSVWFYVKIIRLFYDHLINNMPTFLLNRSYVEEANSIEEIICFLYHGGSKHDTPFWNYAKELTSKRIEKSNRLKLVVEDYSKWNEIGIPSNGMSWCWNSHSLKMIDTDMEYNYFP